ncbi:hypothetical protein EVAR_92337_1 [Eumeta japonica]|uniref:Uncharacterized protein n=1 Tax=Eumeta variegata TaxID=151549 RepID=A0A4C1TLL3_EUMVA|nr:hypothetical protein EVAR_92337_1 [Eumeta japonica]
MPQRHKCTQYFCLRLCALYVILHAGSRARWVLLRAAIIEMVTRFWFLYFLIRRQWVDLSSCFISMQQTAALVR